MEEMNNKLKIFISYSHHDEKLFIEEFKKHLAPLKDKGLVEELLSCVMKWDEFSRE